jgi:hypothetical protein
MRFTSKPAGVRRLALMALLFSATACERIVSVSAPTGEARLVVEARLERARGAASADQLIRLTTTQSVFSTVTPSGARGATVRVVDDSGRATVFSESATDAGVYRATAMTLGNGRTFTLEIGWNGDQYRSTEKMLPAIVIDSLFFIPRLNEAPSSPLRATITARDPVGAKNFYLWDQWIDGVRLTVPDSAVKQRVVATDDLLDGGRIRNFQPYDGWAVSSGQLVRVRQLSISEQAYRFYLTLSEQTASDGSPFAVPASSVRGNVANITSPARVALGYFIAGEYTELERRVP